MKLTARIQSRFRDTWMAAPGFVESLDKTTRERQSYILQMYAQAQGVKLAGSIGPFSVQVLVAHLTEAVAGIVSTSAPLRISIYCSLLGELLVSTLCEYRLAGDINPKIGESKWVHIHGPLMLLRNALFHPGAILPKSGPVGIGNFVHLLIQQLERGARSDLSLKNQLERSPAALASEEMALWAILQLDGVGRYHQDRLRLSGLPLTGGEG